MTAPELPEAFNLADYFLFDRIAEGKGDKIALRFGDRSWTYAEVADRSRALALYLVNARLCPEQRVYIVLPDLPPFAWSIFATLAAGGVVTMGNNIAPVDDLRHVLDYVRASVLITTTAVASSLLPHYAQLPHLKLVLLSSDAATDEDPEAAIPAETVKHLDELIRETDQTRKHCETLVHAIARGRTLTVDIDLPLPRTRRDDPAIWLFTSGSTGKSKAAMHSHRDFAFNTEVFVGNASVTAATTSSRKVGIIMMRN